MTDVNHRRTNKKPVNQRYGERDYHNGYAYSDNKQGAEKKAELLAEAALRGFAPENVRTAYTSAGCQRVGRTDYLDKSMHGWGRKSTLADTTVGASIGNDFANGHRGMAKAVKGAKKFVRTRIRFKENEATRKLAKNLEED